MIRKSIAAAVSAALLASPGTAAELWSVENQAGARCSAATAGAYLRVPLGRADQERTRAGLRLSMRHDYRDALAPAARLIETDTLELRLIGADKPALFVAGARLDDQRRARLGSVGTVGLVLIGVAAVTGVILLSNAFDDDSSN